MAHLDEIYLVNDTKFGVTSALVFEKIGPVKNRPRGAF